MPLFFDKLHAKYLLKHFAVCSCLFIVFSSKDPNDPSAEKCCQVLMDLVDMNLDVLNGIDPSAYDKSIRKTLKSMCFSYVLELINRVFGPSYHNYPQIHNKHLKQKKMVIEHHHYSIIHHYYPKNIFILIQNKIMLNWKWHRNCSVDWMVVSDQNFCPFILLVDWLRSTTVY